MCMFKHLRLGLWGALLGLISGCNPKSDANLVPISIDKPDTERLLQFYGGGYAAKAGEDPFKAGLMVEKDGQFFWNKAVLQQKAPQAASKLPSGTMDWDVLRAFVQATYNEARAFPATLADFQARYPYQEGFQMRVNGVFSSTERHIFIPKPALRAALDGWKSSREQLLYPTGTVIVGEHHENGALLETTAMLKRTDGFWDFIVYDGAGKLTTTTEARPQALKSPTQCVGCHFGKKKFEPEKSFPNPAPPSPHGELRKIHDTAYPVPASVVALFKEHDKRSDTILGLYTTFFVAELMQQRTQGTLAPEDAARLAQLGL